MFVSKVRLALPVRCTSWITLMSKPPENLPPLPDNAKTERLDMEIILTFGKITYKSLSTAFISLL